MARLKTNLLSSEERALLHEQTLTVLEEVGTAVKVPEAFDLLEEGGATVDRESGVAWLPCAADDLWPLPLLLA